jgi:polyisoprenyl-teichoic acid--peptidoglycan teichoic acid transferase
MSMRRPPRDPDGPLGRGADNANFRGIALVIVAAALGIFLIAKSFDSSSGTPVSSGATTTTTSTVAGGTTSTAPGSTTPGVSNTQVSTPNPGGVHVLVLNASGVNGAAGRLRDTLKGLGYTAAAATAAKQAATTVVYYVDGFKADATNVAAALTLGADSVLLMPNPPPADAKTLGDNTVVVLLGRDKAV